MNNKRDLSLVLRSSVKRKRHGLWIKLISSDWFTSFLEYLSLNEIAVLDSAFCNHIDRHKWLGRLSGSIRPDILVHDDKLIKWFISRSIRPEKLIINFSYVSENIVSELMKYCSSVKQLHFYNKVSSPLINLTTEMMHNLANNSQKLEVLKISEMSVSEDGFEVLSASCHKLQIIEIKNASYCVGLDKLLKVSPVLKELDINIETEFLDISKVVDALGLSCPLLQSCKLVNRSCSRDVTLTDSQIETFTKGCPNLESLKFSFRNTEPNIYELLRCLGTYSHSLQSIHISLTPAPLSQLPILLSRAKRNILQCLSNGCPLLKEISLYWFKLFASDVSYLINHSIYLEVLTLCRCYISDDEVVITKEADKLQHLKRLCLHYNDNITDESIINLVKGCHDLEYIAIASCDKLTDASLFSIAANCPNLETIILDFENAHLTEIGFKELLNKCPKLLQLLDERQQLFLLSFDIKKELLRRNILKQYIEEGLTLSESNIKIETEISSITEISINSKLFSFNV